LITVVSSAVIAWPASIICRRTGYSPWLGIVAIVPIANIALLWFIALSPWTADRATDRPARPSWQPLAFFRSVRERIQTIGLPQKP
jgi:hypothetical protein